MQQHPALMPSINRFNSMTLVMHIWISASFPNPSNREKHIVQLYTSGHLTLMSSTSSWACGWSPCPNKSKNIIHLRRRWLLQIELLRLWSQGVHPRRRSIKKNEIVKVLSSTCNISKPGRKAITRTFSSPSSLTALAEKFIDHFFKQLWNKNNCFRKMRKI